MPIDISRRVCQSPQSQPREGDIAVSFDTLDGTYGIPLDNIKGLVCGEYDLVAADSDPIAVLVVDAIKANSAAGIYDSLRPVAPAEVL